MAKKNEELIELVDKAINELVFPKYQLKKAYNYYNGIRDPEQYRYLEENFGIGSPTSVEFIPLIKKHVDALVGEYLETPILPKITCKDSKTISNIERDKQLKIVGETYNYLKDHLYSDILKILKGKPVEDPLIKQQLDDLSNNIDKTFVSEYEIAAQNVIQYIINSRDTDLHEKLRILLLDLLITGYAFYRVLPSKSKTNVNIEVLDPLNTFVERNPGSSYIKYSYRSVVRKWYSKAQILNEYGDRLSQEDKDSLSDLQERVEGYSSIYVRSFADAATGMPMSDGIDAGWDVCPTLPGDTYANMMFRLVPVYQIEWVEADDDNVMQRYSEVRIGTDIYIIDKEPVKVVRSQDNPTFCTLSTSGVSFNTRSNVPFSLVLACAPLQDKYDILNYYRDSLLSGSGTVGDWLDVSMLPKFLGDTVAERLKKFMAYKKKAGLGLIDTNQDGDNSTLNTIFNGYDNTIKATAIQAIEMSIDRVENTMSSISGVFKERLNGIQQHDAVTNVAVGAKNSFTITKQFTHQMDLLTVELLTDCLNTAKIVWKKGLKGCIILGDKYQKIFTALPEYFTVTDYNINIESNSTVIRDIETIKSIIPEFIKANAMDPDDIIDALDAKSLTELKANVGDSIKRKRAENNQLMQAQQQLQQMQQQLQQLQSENQKLQQQVQQADTNKLQLEQQKQQQDNQLGWYKAKADKEYKDAQAKVDEHKVKVQELQLYDGDARNDKVNWQ